ncbi:hypothetical protein BV25DRAFT_1829344 [Artomyces pyxidatus]|uniref:Uncharacterized protein n=1 Tax=Artomyces pyxidatus TaxID=48021 RepID=A0ACB8ST03_9AGAM|nr:hypothetical protein BV25DRAFT_1829344 [Artomyces pyxidatus]
MSNTSDILSKLPAEINVSFLRRLDFRSLLVCRKVSKFLRTIVDGTASLQYIIELGGSGLREGPLSGASTKERKAMLDKYNTAWRNLEWTSHTKLTETRGNEWQLSGGIWGQLDASVEHENAIYLYRLSSHLRGIEERRWVLQFVLEVYTFSMDPSQDLLVLIHTHPDHHYRHRCYISLVSLSKGVVHPMAFEAQDPSYHFMLNTDHAAGIRDARCSVQICGDHVGLLLAYGEFYILNWRTGVLKLSCLFENPISFTFLDSDHVAVVGGDERDTSSHLARLAIYSLGSDEPQVYKDGVYEADGEDPCLCSFLLPSFMDPMFMFDRGIKLSSDSCPAADGDVPFTASHDESLVVVRFASMAHGRDSFCLFVRSKTLLSHIRETHNTLGREIPWAEWGPRATRLISYREGQFPRAGSVQGMRYLWSKPVSFADGDSCVLLWDFYAHWTKTADEYYPLADQNEEELGKYGQICYPNGEKQLPYTEHGIALPPDLKAHSITLLLSEDTIIALKRINLLDLEVHLLTF